ncbi:MAG: class I adenylate-forming enzyme family protein [Burkholderiaceae bacterium]|nr:class I adenylate-forming enzyme family protein [Burkholderiaceae bacterium]
MLKTPPHPHLDDPSPHRVLADWLDAHAVQHAERDAITFGATRMTYAELRRKVDQCARAYLAHGIKNGDCIAMLCSPRPEAFISFLAAAKIGALWLGLNPRYQLPELSYVVGDSQPKLLLSIDSLEGRSYAPDIEILAQQNPGIRATVIMERRGEDGSSFDDWTASFTDPALDAQLASARAGVEDTAPALLVYTSGSSGKPKGVLLRHRELIRRSRTQNERFPVSSYPRLINPLPVNHIGGMHFLGLFTFIGAGTLRFAERFSAAEFVAALQSGSINTMIVLPTMFKMIVDEPGFSKALLGKLEWFVFSGAAMAPELLELIRSTGCPTGLTYGMTETCGSVTYSDPDADVETLANTIGRAVPEGEARVANDDGLPCAPGVPGELQIRAEYCMGGYLNRPQATAEAFTEDGWLHTGDTAVMREDGNIRFIGRRSEMYKSGGYNVYPREVELALETHEAVVLSAVVSVPDPLYDEVGWAFIVPAPGRQLTEKEASDWCKSQLANYKVPKRFIICTDLPLLPVGKVDKVKLKAQARERSAAPA